MDTCQEFAALLDLYVDGELPPAEAERVQAHLETCGVCRSYVDDIQAIRAAFPTIEDTPVPEGFADGVMAAIRAGKAPRKRRSAPRWARVALPLAACLAIFAVVQVPLLQRDTAADQAVGQEQIQDIADTSSEKAQSHQETEEAVEPETTQTPTAEEDLARESAPSQNDVISPKVSAQAPSNYYSLQESQADSGNPQEDALPSVESAQAPAQTTTQPPTQSADEPQTPGTANTLTTAPADESSGEKSDERSVFAMLSLSAAQAVSLPEDVVPVSTEADGSVCYHLTPAQYDDLLSALSEQGETPEPSFSAPELRDTADAYAVVTVYPE